MAMKDPLSLKQKANFLAQFGRIFENEYQTALESGAFDIAKIVLRKTADRFQVPLGSLRDLETEYRR